MKRKVQRFGRRLESDAFDLLAQAGTGGVLVGVVSSRAMRRVAMDLAVTMCGKEQIVPAAIPAGVVEKIAVETLFFDGLSANRQEVMALARQSWPGGVARPDPRLRDRAFRDACAVFARRAAGIFVHDASGFVNLLDRGTLDRLTSHVKSKSAEVLAEQSEEVCISLLVRRMRAGQAETDIALGAIWNILMPTVTQKANRLIRSMSIRNAGHVLHDLLQDGYIKFRHIAEVYNPELGTFRALLTRSLDNCWKDTLRRTLRSKAGTFEDDLHGLPGDDQHRYRKAYREIFIELCKLHPLEDVRLWEHWKMSGLGLSAEARKNLVKQVFATPKERKAAVKTERARLNKLVQPVQKSFEKIVLEDYPELIGSLEQAIARAEVLLSAADPWEGKPGLRLWGISLLTDYIGSQPEAIWNFALTFACGDSRAIRHYIGRTFLKRLLRRHFDKYFDRMANMARTNPLFCDALTSFGPLRKPNSPDQIARFEALLKEFEAN